MRELKDIVVVGLQNGHVLLHEKTERVRYVSPPPFGLLSRRPWDPVMADEYVAALRLHADEVEQAARGGFDTFTEQERALVFGVGRRMREGCLATEPQYTPGAQLVIGDTPRPARKYVGPYSEELQQVVEYAVAPHDVDMPGAAELTATLLLRDFRRWLHLLGPTRKVVCRVGPEVATRRGIGGHLLMHWRLYAVIESVAP